MNMEYSDKNVLVPLGDSATGRLIFARVTENVVFRVDSTISSLCKAHFQGVIPKVQADKEGIVEVRYPRFGLITWLYAQEETRAGFVLNGRFPWSIEVHGGLSRLDADLRELRLEKFDVVGGVSKAFLQLPEPVGEVSLRIHGGVSDVVFSRPPGSAAQCRVRGGAAALSFDDQWFGAIGGESVLETSDFKNSSNRFNLEVSGGAGKLTMQTYTLSEIGGVEIVSRKTYSRNPVV